MPALRLFLLLIGLGTAVAVVATPATPVAAVLARAGVRGAALGRLAKRAAADDTAAAAAALELALSELEAAGVDGKAVARLLTQQPRALAPLLARSPAALLAGMATAGLPPAAELLRAEPMLLTLDARALRAALVFLSTFLVADANQTVSEFVASQPQALLWRSERESPVLVALEEMGLPPRTVHTYICLYLSFFLSFFLSRFNA